MYKIIGADGKEYGPVNGAQVRQWIAEGRIGPQTKAQAAGSTDWRPLVEFAEFADVFATGTSTPMTSAVAKVKGPAIGLIVTAILGAIVNLFALGWNIAGPKGEPIPNLDPELERIIEMFGGTLGIVSAIIAIVFAGLILYGALKMKKLEGYAWAMTAAILALIPCTSPCCVIGLPIGIWALVVLLQSEVKAQFH